MVRLSISLASIAVALATAVTAQESTNTWSVAFYQSEACTGLGVGEQNGPETPQLSQVCNAVPEPGFTAGMIYRVASGEYSYVLRVHNTDDCSDNLGVYEGDETSPTCIALAGATHYSIQTIAIIGRAEPNAQNRRGEGAAIARPEKRSELAARQVSGLTLAEFALAAAVPAATFSRNIPSSCFATRADDANIQNAECALDVTYTVIFSTITAWAVRGLLRRTGYISKRDMGMGDGFERMFDAGETNFDDIVIPGVSTSFSRGSIERRDDGDWHSYVMNSTDFNSGKEYLSHFSHNPATGKQRVSSMPSSPESYSSNDALSARDIRARQSYQVTATYSWLYGTESSFSATEDDAERLAAQAWNFGKDNNKDTFCANLQAYNSGRQLVTIDAGAFSLSRAGDPYTDHSNDCA